MIVSTLNQTSVFNSLATAIDTYAHYMTGTIFPKSAGMSAAERMHAINTYARIKNMFNMVKSNFDALSEGTRGVIMEFAWLYGVLNNRNTFNVVEMVAFENEAAQIIRNIRLETNATVH